MSSKSQLTKKEAAQQQVQRSSQGARDVEVQEHHASANASVRSISPALIALPSPNLPYILTPSDLRMMRGRSISTYSFQLY